MENGKCGRAAGVRSDQGTGTTTDTAARLVVCVVISAAVVCVCFCRLWFGVSLSRSCDRVSETASKLAG